MQNKNVKIIHRQNFIREVAYYFGYQFACQTTILDFKTQLEI